MELSSLPTAGGNFVAGTFSFWRDPLTFLTGASRRGDLVRVMFGTEPSYFLSHPRFIEAMLVEHPKAWSKDRFARVELGQVLGQGLLTSDGDAWRRSRRLAQPAFHKERINGYAQLMVDLTEAASAKIEAHKRFDVHHFLMHLTLEIVSEAIFGTQVGAEGDVVGEALDVVSERWTDITRIAFPALDRLPLEKNRRFADAISKLDQIVHAMIAKGRQRPPGGTDLLAMLLAARDEDGSAFSDQQLRDEIMTIYLAGHETTALALSWTLVLLSRHPAVEWALGEELSRVLGDRPPTLADLPKLDLTGRIVLESMRLYPPAWAIGRETVEPVEIGGVMIPPKQQVWASAWVMHRSPKYFRDPEVFDPDRWPKGVGGVRASEAEMQKTLPRCVYFPFGAGPRLCIGQQFAIMEAVLVLASLARRWRFSLTSDARIVPLASVTLRPKYGVQVIASPRQ